MSTGGLHEAGDLAPQPDLGAPHGPGPVRSRRPVYVDLLPPCNQACPAGENIQAWLAHCQDGNFRAAWDEIVRNNPFPAVHGRVCYHPCESGCNRKDLDQPVSIHAVERFLGDSAIQEGWQFEKPPALSGKRVLVVGAGPSGLSAAYHLARRGHGVTVFEAAPVAGGMMRFGIPRYRLPRDILDAEIQRIEQLGVAFVFNRRVSDLDAEWRAGGFDAVFVAVGAHLSRRVDIPARDSGRIYDALAFLHDVEDGSQPLLGRRVAVYGGGNTAMDTARTAKRLGASETIIIYRRNRDRAPAHEEEIEDALAEGVQIHWLSTIRDIDHSRFTIERMALNADGWPEPTGEVETLEADTLVLALGQNADTAFLASVDGVDIKADGTVQVDACMMTGRPGLFMGGDMVPCERTVTVGVGHGKKAARNIDAYLRAADGLDVTSPAKNTGIATFDRLHLWLYTDAAQQAESRAAGDLRTASFSEVVEGLDAEAALYESRRCLSCGNCFECDGCLAACPEDAVIKLAPGKRYRFDYARCTGCAACYEQCPCGAIEMNPEPQS